MTKIHGSVQGLCCPNKTRGLISGLIICRELALAERLIMYSAVVCVSVCNQVLSNISHKLI